MADRYSAQWWNDQARAAGGLYKADIERLTGMTFPTVWSAAPPGAWDFGTILVPWYLDVRNRAPGFAQSGLLLSPGAGQGSLSAEDHIGNSEWPMWVLFVSPVGYVAPGANAPWNPPLSPVYTPPATSLPANSPPITTQPPATTTPSTPATGSTIGGIPVKTLAIGAGAVLLLLMVSKR